MIWKGRNGAMFVKEETAGLVFAICCLYILYWKLRKKEREKVGYLVGCNCVEIVYYVRAGNR